VTDVNARDDDTNERRVPEETQDGGGGDVSGRGCERFVGGSDVPGASETTSARRRTPRKEKTNRDGKTDEKMRSTLMIRC
jgi:hypothetical protein